MLEPKTVANTTTNVTSKPYASYTSEKKNLTSGGLEGARYGACFMVGGRAEGIKIA
jgi:hypothetical protein